MFRVFLFAGVFIPCEVSSDGVFVEGFRLGVFATHVFSAFWGTKVGCEVVFVDDGV